MTYIKAAFEPLTIDYAKHVVLTSDPNDPDKFERETDFLVNTIKDNKLIDSNSKVVDFGCGMGRVSRELVNRIGCDVIGVDFSERMRMFATFYVGSGKFSAVPEYVEKQSVDVCLAILVLQHVENPAREIDNLYDITRPGGKLILVNEDTRHVPTGISSDNYVIWSDDGFDVFKYTESRFRKLRSFYDSNNRESIRVYEK